MNSNEEDREIKIGSNFILYKDKKLGKGAFGEIHLGKNIKDKIDVAIKKVILYNKRIIIFNFKFIQVFSNFKIFRKMQQKQTLNFQLKQKY